MTDRTIEYKLVIDTETGKKTITDLDGNIVKLDDNIKKAKKSTKDMTQDIRDLGLAYQGMKTFITDVYNYTKIFIDASIAETKATKNLTEEQRAYSRALEAQTGVSDVVISQAQISLKVMGLNTEQVKEASKYTALLVSGGLSLEDSMKKSAAMVTQNYGELGELIPSIKVAKTEQEKLNLATDYFAAKSKLASEATREFSGSLKRNKNDIENITAEIGNAIVSLGGVAKYLDLSDSFEYLKAGLASIVNAFIQSADGFTTPFVIMYKYAINVFEGIKTAFNETISGNFAGALDAIKNIGIKNLEIMKAEYAESQQISQNYTDIWNQANQNISDKKAELLTKDAEAAKTARDKQTEEEKQAAAEKLALERLIFDETMKLENELTAQLQTEEEKRFASYSAIKEEKRLKTISDAETAMQSEMDLYLTSQPAINEQKLLDEANFQAQVLSIETGTQQARIDALKNYKITYDEYQKLELDVKKKTDAAKKQSDEDYFKSGLKNTLNQLQALKQFGSEGAAIAKTAAIAETTINTIDAAQGSYKWAASWGGPIAGAVAAAIAYAAGAARVAQITATSTGFYDGGYTGSGNEKGKAGDVHFEEYVNTAKTVRRVGIPALDALESGMATIVPVSDFRAPAFGGSINQSGFDNVSGSVQAMNTNMVNNSTSNTPIVNINASLDWIKFEVERRNNSVIVDRTNYNGENI